METRRAAQTQTARDMYCRYMKLMHLLKTLVAIDMRRRQLSARARVRMSRRAHE